MIEHKRKYLITGFFILLVLLVVIVGVGLQVGKMRKETTEIDNGVQHVDFISENTNFSFVYPSNWKILDDVKTDLGAFRRESLKIISEGNDFEIFLSSHNKASSNPDDSLCEKYNDCGGITGRQVFPYDENNFEYFVLIDKTEILISESGASEVIVTEKGLNYASSNEIEVDVSYRLFQQYEDGLTFELTLFNHNDESDFFSISYVFKNEESIKMWSEYKEILLQIVQSLNWQRD